MLDYRTRRVDIAAEVQSLPLPPEHLWIRPRRTTPIAFRLLVAVAVAVALIGVALPFADLLAQDRLRSSPASATTPPSVPLAVPAAETSAGAAVPPFCADGSPLINVAQPPPPGEPPGSGAPNPEAAFRKAFPAITSFAMYPFGGPRAPVWIVAAGKTYIAMFLGAADGANNWFAYPATFVRCRSIEEIRRS